MYNNSGGGGYPGYSSGGNSSSSTSASTGYPGVTSHANASPYSNNSNTNSQRPLQHQQPRAILTQQQQHQPISKAAANAAASSQAFVHPNNHNNSNSVSRNPVHTPWVLKDFFYEQGKVKALLIGINYKGQGDIELDGAVNDVKTMLTTLKQICFPIDDCVILVDDPSFPNNGGMPTKRNILYWLNWLVDDLEDGDVVFLHIAGHAAQQKQACPDGTEKDDMDQVLIPLDHATAGVIVDDDLNAIMSRMPTGTRATIIVDTCNSGSIFDLPYTLSAKADSRSFYQRSSDRLFDKINNNTTLGGDIVMISGCEDGKSSADATGFSFKIPDKDERAAGGAATCALAEILTQTAGLTYGEVLFRLRESLQKRKFKQVPQLSATRPIDLTKPFSLFGTLANVTFTAYSSPLGNTGSNNRKWIVSQQQQTMKLSFPKRGDATWTPPAQSSDASLFGGMRSFGTAQYANPTQLFGYTANSSSPIAVSRGISAQQQQQQPHSVYNTVGGFVPSPLGVGGGYPGAGAGATNPVGYPGFSAPPPPSFQQQQQPVAGGGYPMMAYGGQAQQQQQQQQYRSVYQ